MVYIQINMDLYIMVILIGSFQKDYTNIIIIGGSTTEGANSTSSNDNTIAAHLEKS